MPRRPRPLAPGLVYHVLARGNHREPVFLSRRDYRVYLARLTGYRHQFQAMVHAYCLMPNHVHLLVQTGQMPLSGLMQGLQQSYTQYFNRTYGTVGHVFQGRYKAYVCAHDAYLATLVRYIHLNPVRASLVASPEDYSYSSHGAYLNGRPTGLVDPRPILRLLGGPGHYRQLLLAPAATDEKDGPWKGDGDAADGQPRGDEATDAGALDAGGSVRRPARELPTALVYTLARQLGTGLDVVRSADRRWKVSRARSLIAFTLVRRLGYPIGVVATALERTPTSVGILVWRAAQRLESDDALSAAVSDLCGTARLKD